MGVDCFRRRNILRCYGQNCDRRLYFIFGQDVQDEQDGVGCADMVYPEISKPLHKHKYLYVGEADYILPILSILSKKNTIKDTNIKSEGPISNRTLAMEMYFY